MRKGIPSFLKPKKRQTPEAEENEALIKEIKRFFFAHHGDGMSMDRADPKKYDLYCTMKDGRVEAWRQELIASDLALLYGNRAPERVWITVGNLLRSIYVSHTERESNAEKLLTWLLEHARELDKRQRILILEHFAGRTSHWKDGGIYMIRVQTDLTALLVRVIDGLSDFRTDASDNTDELGWQDTVGRHAEVLRAIRSAYEAFGVASK